jgi:hypothetical protein
MFIIDDLLIGGIRFVLDKVATVVDQEMNNPETYHQRLMQAQMDFEEGRIDEATLATIEEDVVARLRELRDSEQIGGIADAESFDDIEIEVPDIERS